jgi:uncharacterized membrane protein
MNLEFMVFANLLLLARLRCLFKDDASEGLTWLNKTALELAALVLLYRGGGMWIVAAVTVAGLNLLGFWVERHVRRKDFVRLLLGAAAIGLFSIWFSPRLGLTFRPGLTGLPARLSGWTVLAPWLELLASLRVQLILFGMLLVANEANLVIRAVFDWLDLKPRVKSADDGAIDVGEFNRGRVIGILERVLLYGFILQAQYGAIGFILAAKAFTRFKALENRSFAEYVLIGTLLSACLALATGVLLHGLLP